MRTGLHALRLLVRSAPIACVVTAITAVLQGIGPNLITVAAARLVGAAPEVMTSATARADAVRALAFLAGALAVERMAAALAPATFAYLRFSFVAALDRIRLRSGATVPGLEHFESPELADRLEAAGWSRDGAPHLLNETITVLRRTTMLVGALVIVSLVAWWVPLLVSLAAIAIGLNDWWHAGRQNRSQRDAATPLRYAEYHQHLAMEPRVAREVRLLDLGSWLAGRQWSLWSDATAPVFADLRRQLRENSVINLVRLVVLLLSVIVAVARLRAGTISAESFTAAVLALRTASNGMYVLEGIPGRLRKATGFLPETFVVADLPTTEPRLTISGRRKPPMVLRDGIRFEGVTFAYPGTSRRVLDRIDLDCPAGESLAIVGVNGAGKSTLVKLLCRFYDPTEGRITVDGADIREFDLVQWRARMAVILQDITRFPVTAAENVTLASDRRDLIMAADQAGVRELLEALPNGWDTVVGTEFGGVELSGGQWQRVALARLLARRAGLATPVLVLDEPTSALDADVEADLYRTFGELTAGATTLMISHRFSTVRLANRVAVLENGRIVEHGSHADLITVDGRYAELFELQASRFREREVDR